MKWREVEKGANHVTQEFLVFKKRNLLSITVNQGSHSLTQLILQFGGRHEVFSAELMTKWFTASVQIWATNFAGKRNRP